VRAGQRSFDELGTPLADVTFVVLDLETTGASPQTYAITEVGAVKFRGGELLGTFQTLVNPGMAVPPEITYLTGITEAMVLPAPPIEAVLGPLASFVENNVIVGHNVRFDLRFLAAAMDRHGWPRFTNVVVDTCALARRLIRDEVPNCRLATLAQHLRSGHRPTHRALDDAWATAEVLHALLERAGTLGVLALDDLVALPSITGHPQLSKLKLVANLPRCAGVYLFRDRSARVLYVGKAVDLRRRVRSYFSGDERRKVGALLREVASIDHIVCTNELQASVLEVRLIHELAPHYNRHAKLWRRYAYVKLTLDERFPRLSVVRAARAGDGCLYLGPLGSSSVARQVVEAIQTAAPIRRCTGRPARTLRPSPCAPAQLGVATCPCAGTISQSDYRVIVDRVVDGLTRDPSLLLDPLAARMQALAQAQRYEEAADMRNRAAALARVLTRQRRLDALRQAGRLELRLPDDAWAVVEAGLLQSTGTDGGGHPPPGLPLPVEGTGDPRGPLPRHMADEVATIASWLDSRATKVRIVACAGELSSPLPRLPTFEPLDGGPT